MADARDVASNIRFALLCSTASDDKSVKLWNVYSGATLRSIDLQGEVKFLVYLQGHRLIASCTMGIIVVIDTTSGEIVTKVDTSDVPFE